MRKSWVLLSKSMKKASLREEPGLGVHPGEENEKLSSDAVDSKINNGQKKRTYINTFHSDDDFVVDDINNDAAEVRKMKHPNKYNRKPKVVNGNSKYNKPLKKGKLNTRQCPSKLVKILSVLSTEQKQWLTEMGFHSLITFEIETIPTRLAYWVVDSFDSVKCVFKVGASEYKITRHSVHEILGFPMGEGNIDCVKKAGIYGDSIHKKWRGQFEGPVKGRKRIYVSDVINTIKRSNEVGFFYKLNILVVIMTVLAEGISCATANQKILPFISNEYEIKRIDWCGYVIECLKRSKANWDRKIQKAGTQDHYFF